MCVDIVFWQKLISEHKTRRHEQPHHPFIKLQSVYEFFLHDYDWHWHQTFTSLCERRTESQHPFQKSITDSHIVPTTNSHGIVRSSHNTRDNNDKRLARFCAPSIASSQSNSTNKARPWQRRSASLWSKINCKSFQICRTFYLAKNHTKNCPNVHLKLPRHFSFHGSYPSAATFVCLLFPLIYLSCDCLYWH